MTQTLNIPQGETIERVLVDQPELDWHIVQQAHSVLRLHLVSFTSAKHTIWVEQQGEGCQTEIYGLTFVRNNETCALNTRVHHNIGGGTSKQVVKFILGGESKGEFFGELKIAPDAQQTAAQQTNRNILLSDKATMRTRPQLEIYADDVKASHGATTGQLDESALFYMQQRGLSPEQGRQMLLQAFMADIIDAITDEAQRTSLVNAIDTLLS